MQELRVAIVGLRGHAGRHIRLVQQQPEVRLQCVFYHRPAPKELAHLPITNDIGECLAADVVIISTPTALHASQLQLLEAHRGYTLVEKPAADRPEDIRALLQLPDERKSRIQVNFNFLFHELATRLTELRSSPLLGDLFAADFHASHGGSFRSDWKDSWRLSGAANLGPLETVGIHFVQFALTQYGRCTKSIVRTESLSKAESRVDTGVVDMATESGVWVRVRTSYAAPQAIKMELWGTNGYAVYDGETLAVYSPRETYDDRGRFASPPAAISWGINYESCWRKSLELAQRHLFELARSGKRLDPATFDRDVSSMSVLLDAQGFDSSRGTR